MKPKSVLIVPRKCHGKIAFVTLNFNDTKRCEKVGRVSETPPAIVSLDDAISEVR